jgi:hypothetical protein
VLQTYFKKASNKKGPFLEGFEGLARPIGSGASPD